MKATMAVPDEPALRRTSVQLDQRVVEAARRLYPVLRFSEIVRLSMDFLLEQAPRYVASPRDGKFERRA